MKIRSERERERERDVREKTYLWRCRMEHWLPNSDAHKDSMTSLLY